MMKRLMLALPLAVFALIGVIALVMLNASSDGSRDTTSIGFSMTGASLPQLSMPRHDSDGIVNLGDYSGEVFAVNVFASWCAPCRLEASSIEQLSLKIPVIGINYRDDAGDADRFLEQFGNPFTAIGRDPDGAASIQLGVHGLPETFIIGRDGEILYHHQGPVFATELSGVIAEAVERGKNG